MTQVPESLSRRTLSERALADPFVDRAPAPSAQDAFLNRARRDRIAVTIHLMSGHAFDARITAFDRYAVVVDVDGTEQLVFKHAIALIETARAGAYAPPRS